MLITCWSSKGGSGTTVVAAALAVRLAAEAGGVLLVDLGGDQPAALGLPEPTVGLSSCAPDPGGAASLAGHVRHLAIDAGGGVRLLPRGVGPLDPRLGPPLAHLLGGPEPVVVDAGAIGPGAALDLAAAATASLLVLRPCFLALRRAVAAPLRGSGVVLVDEPHRVLGVSDVEAALGIPVVAVVPWDAAIARRVDAGLLGSGLPRPLARALRDVPGTTVSRAAPATDGVPPLRPVR